MSPQAFVKAKIKQFPKTKRRDVDLEEAMRQMLQEYGCHLVALSGLQQPLDQSGKPKGKPGFIFCSGFIIQLRRSWWWVTAGHNLSAIEMNRKSKTAEYSRFRLIDSYGTGENREPIPFDYDNARKIIVDDKATGADYGLIELNSLQTRMLKANHIIALPKKEWDNTKPLPAHAFLMFGFPEDSYNPSSFETRNSYVVRANPSVSAFYIKPVRRIQKSWQRKYPRLIGKVGSKDDIKGMSGGPIFGINLETLEKRLIAVQSGWLKSKRIIFGFPIALVGRLAERELAKN